jgi:hypothetical protein
MRRAIIEVECERCSRVEKIPAEAGTEIDRPIFRLQFGSETIKYDDLCTNCLNLIRSFFSKLGPISKSSPRRGQADQPTAIQDTKKPSGPMPPPTVQNRAPRG